MQYVVYERDESGIITRTGRRVTMAAAEKTARFPHAEQLTGWPEHAVRWNASRGPALGLAPLAKKAPADRG